MVTKMQLIHPFSTLSTTNQPYSITSCQSLPLQRFQVLLTLFSKFFASFPHGTCSLSVSRLYLALRGTYLALWAILSNSPTLEVVYG